MAHPQYTPALASLEEAISVLFCLLDDTSYALLNPDGRSHESLKRLSDSEVLTLALFQQLRGIESERSSSAFSGWSARWPRRSPGWRPG